MAIADSSQVQVRYIAETIWGAVPTPTAVFKNVNVTNESLGKNTAVTNSEFIRSDTNIAGTFRTGESASGTLGIELQYGGYDDLLEGLYRGTFATPLSVSSTACSAAASDNSFNGTSLFGNAIAGQWIKVSGFATAANNGFFKVITATANKITVAGGTLINESVGPTVVMKGSLLRNGTTQKSYAVEVQYTNVTQFKLITGNRIGSGTINIAPGAIITGDFAFQGKTVTLSGSTSSTSTPTAAATTSSMNAVDNIEGIYFGNVLSTANFNNLTFTINTNLRDQPAIGSLPNIGIGQGSITIEGTIEAYFEDASQYNRHLNFTSTSLAVVAQDAAGNAYVFDFPTVNFTGGNPTAGGINQDVTVPLTFTATLNSTYSSSAEVTRIPA